jgi:hypothetical protein
VIGIFLAIAGILLTADNFGYLEASAFLRFWPAVLIVLGLLKLQRPETRVVGIVLLVAGLWILAFNLGAIAFTIFDFWPLFLIGIGVVLVRKSLRPEAPAPAAVAAAPSEGSSTGGTIKTFAVLSEQRARPGPGFTGGSIGAFLGASYLDLSDVVPSSNPIEIDVTAFMAGIEIKVPQGWEVVGEVLPVMGGFELKTGPATEPKRQLVVRGFVMMGGIEVKNSERS